MDSEKGSKAQGTQDTHDDTCEGDATDNGYDTLLEVHVKEASGQGAGPRPGSGQRDADEEEQGYIESATRFGL